jgi:hypothetical protein
MDATTLDILVILDRSGSMQMGRADHEGGLRSFVKDQQQLPGDVRFTLVQFDSHDPCEIVFDRTPIREVDADSITLIPRGGTPLYQAIGEAVSHLRSAVGDGSNLVCMIITDGQNTDWHTEWNASSVKQLIAEREKAGWSTLFLGANIDTFAEAAAIGVGGNTSVSYSNAVAGSVANLYNVTSMKVGLTRSVVQEQGIPMAAAAASFMTYDDMDRTAIEHGSEFDASTGTFTSSKTLTERLADYKASKQTNTVTITGEAK